MGRGGVEEGGDDVGDERELGWGEMRRGEAGGGG